MAFTRTARKALRKKRANAGETLLTVLMKQGEDAKARGMPESACPYPLTSEEGEAWLFGYND